MSGAGLLDQVPLGLLALATIGLIQAAVELGLWLGRRHKERDPQRDAPVGAMVAAMLGLLAFVLAFTFGLAASRFDERRHTILDEANAIGTAYLRAGLLPEPEREISQALLREYVDARATAVQTGRFQEGLARSVELQKRLWTQAVAAAGKDPRSLPTSLYLQSLNQMIDLHATRVMVGLRSRIPITIWIALFFIAVLAMGAMGYHHGLTGTNRHFAALALVVVFSVILLLVVDLDRPLEGLLQVSQQPLRDLRQTMTP